MAKFISTAPNQPHPFNDDVVLTMWESTRLDPTWVANLNKARAVLVPCQWCLDLFRDSGVSVPLRIVPLGYYPSIYQPTVPEPEGVTVFGCAGRTSHGGSRKGLEQVARAFLDAFPNEQDVRLEVKIWEDCRFDYTPDPRIIVNRQALTDNELADWYRSLSVFVSASKSEGWGLQPHQAMACGRPVVACHYGGHAVYMTPESTYPVAFTEEPVPDGYPIYGGLGDWSIPEHDSLISQMRAAYLDPEERRRKGEAAAKRALDFTWEGAGKKLVEALKEYGLIKSTEPTEVSASKPKTAKLGNPSIALLAWKRPEDLRQCLQALSKVRGIENCLILPHVEPGCEETRALIEGIDFAESRPIWNSSVLGAAQNARNGFEDAFTFADFAIMLEEDILLAHDALEYLIACRDQFRSNAKVASVTCYNRRNELPQEADWHTCRSRVWYHGWASGMWKDRFEKVKDLVVSGNWDTQICDFWKSKNLSEIYPELSRCQNIGEVTTCQDPVAFPPEWYRENHRLKVWAGDLEVSPGDWRFLDIPFVEPVARDKGCGCGGSSAVSPELKQVREKARREAVARAMRK